MITVAVHLRLIGKAACAMHFGRFLDYVISHEESGLLAASRSRDIGPSITRRRAPHDRDCGHPDRPGGTVIDGSGGPGFRADIAVCDDRIVMVGADLVVQAGMRIDAGGKVVTPGFIDTHTHDDRALLSDPTHAPKVSQGVTTLIAGNCGAEPCATGDRGPPAASAGPPGDGRWLVPLFALPRFRQRSGRGTTCGELWAPGRAHHAPPRYDEQSRTLGERSRNGCHGRQGRGGKWKRGPLASRLALITQPPRLLL